MVTEDPTGGPKCGHTTYSKGLLFDFRTPLSITRPIGAMF